ncbi:MAG: cupin domain-containing protein [Proteobacteria bacterium]|nr:cupin domain-containing protein [Pseudomonadota bacterium]
MQVNRIGDIKEYDAPGHFDMQALRMHGLGASDAKSFSVGLSHFYPGGGTTHTASPPEKVYVCLEGEITVITDDGEEVLGPMDSCYIGSNEGRSIANRTDKNATILVIVSAA